EVAVVVNPEGIGPKQALVFEQRSGLGVGRYFEDALVVGIRHVEVARGVDGRAARAGRVVKQLHVLV
nr:hypothetical protein [Tanacetum cinerariifolium]